MAASSGSMANKPKRKTLMQQQSEVTTNDPFGMSERIVKKVSNDMEASKKKYNKVQEETAYIKRELERVNRSEKELQKEYDEWNAEAQARMNTHDHLVETLKRCKANEHSIMNTAYGIAQDNRRKQSEWLKIEARQSLQENRGFYSGQGSTCSKKETLARNRLMHKHQAATRSLPQLGSLAGGNSTFNNTSASMLNTAGSSGREHREFGM